MILPNHHLLPRRAPEGTVATPPAAPAAPAPAPSPAPAAPAPEGGSAPVDPPSSATSGTVVPESPKGSASLIDEMDRMMAKPEPERERGPDGKFKVADPKPGEGKPLTKPSEKPPVEPAKDKDPVALRKRLAEVEGQLKQTQAEKEAELTKLNTKLAELEKRRFLTPEEEARVKKMEERAQQIEADLASRDYRQTEEFKRQFTLPWQNEWRAAVSNVKQLQIEDGETQEVRAANETDFERVRQAGTFIQQRIMAKSLFGDNWDVVMQHLNNLRSLEDRAAQAVADKERSFESERQNAHSSYESKYQETDANLVQKYPKYFGDDPDMPEATAEMKKGLDYIDKALAQMDKATPAERAVANAVIRRWAASFPRMVFLSEKKDAEIAALKEKLAKFEASDPGAVGGGGGEAPQPTNTGGIDALVAEFDKR